MKRKYYSDSEIKLIITEYRQATNSEQKREVIKKYNIHPTTPFKWERKLGLRAKNEIKKPSERIHSNESLKLNEKLNFHKLLSQVLSLSAKDKLIIKELL